MILFVFGHTFYCGIKACCWLVKSTLLLIQCYNLWPCAAYYQLESLKRHISYFGDSQFILNNNNWKNPNYLIFLFENHIYSRLKERDTVTQDVSNKISHNIIRLGIESPTVASLRPCFENIFNWHIYLSFLLPGLLEWSAQLIKQSIRFPGNLIFDTFAH